MTSRLVGFGIRASSRSRSQEVARQLWKAGADALTADEFEPKRARTLRIIGTVVPNTPGVDGAASSGGAIVQRLELSGASTAIAAAVQAVAPGSDFSGTTVVLGEECLRAHGDAGLDSSSRRRPHGRDATASDLAVGLALSVRPGRRVTAANE